MVPKWVWNNTEYFLVFLGFAGVLTAVSQIEGDSQKTESVFKVAEAEQIFGSLLYAMEHKLEQCNVWWDVALDQTNDNPRECNVSKECKTICRAGHMVTQYRWRPVSSNIDSWDNLEALVCATKRGKPISSDQKPPEELKPICKDLNNFTTALTDAHNATLKSENYNKYLSSFSVLVFIQLLAGIGFGIEVGKLRNRKIVQNSIV